MMATIFRDTAVVLVAKNLRSLNSSSYIENKKRPIKGSNNLFWCLRVYGAQLERSRIGIWVSELPITASVSFSVDRLQSIERKFEKQLEFFDRSDNELGFSVGQFCKNGYEITFTEFEKPPSVLVKPPRILDFIRSDEDDVKFIVGKEHVKVSRHFLSMISPVFRAMFVHETKESKTGIINIVDFDAEIVKIVFDYCYGQQIDLCLEGAFEMHRFADKYVIQPVVDKLVDVIGSMLDVKTFCAITEFAWTYEKEDVKLKCATMFRTNSTDILFTRSFVDLDPGIQNKLIIAAALV
uniref:BTB domain-containing protein n=1 Tax=Panagrellus redivivus TaxID=6233 RepID=A0A7E4W4C5_PANRE